MQEEGRKMRGGRVPEIRRRHGNPEIPKSLLIGGDQLRDGVGSQRTDSSIPVHSHSVTRAQEELLYMVGLTKIDHIGPVLGRILIEHFGSAKSVFFCTEKELLKIPGIGPRTASNILRGRGLLEAEKELNRSFQKDVKVISILDPDYPKSLKEIYDAPLVLYKRGGFDLNSQPLISIVGTRMPSEYGRIVAQSFTEFFVEKGFCVVSGLAFGIDAAVHRKVLEKEGQTVAVLGHGFGTIYPQEHWQEARSIEQRGALLTEFGSEVLPEARNFPMRNRIISGLSHATIVIEAGQKGGALITARSAFEQNRSVYAIPGDLTRSQAQGSNSLIRDQIAKMVLHPSEVIEDLMPSVEHMLEEREIGLKPSIQVTDLEERILDLVSAGPQFAGTIGQSIAIPLGKLRAILVGLEVKGVIRKEVGGRYISTSLGWARAV